MLSYLNFNSLEGVSCLREPQPRVGEHLSLFVEFKTDHLQKLMFKRSFE